MLFGRTRSARYTRWASHAAARASSAPYHPPRTRVGKRLVNSQEQMTTGCQRDHPALDHVSASTWLDRKDSRLGSIVRGSPSAVWRRQTHESSVICWNALWTRATSEQPPASGCSEESCYLSKQTRAQGFCSVKTEAFGRNPRQACLLGGTDNVSKKKSCKSRRRCMA